MTTANNMTGQNNKITALYCRLSQDDLPDEKAGKRKRQVEDEAGLVDTGKIVRFLKSDLGERMLIASAKKKLYLEEPFVLGLDARLLNNTCSSNETVLIQGIIDAFFIERQGV